MVDLGLLAARLADADDLTSAAEQLAERLLELIPGGAARVYVMEPGDRCGTCPRVRDCTVQERCLHLEASFGACACPPGSVDRIPLDDEAWGPAARGSAPELPIGVPRALEAPESDAADGVALLLPLIAAGEVMGVAGIRSPTAPSADLRAELETSAFLGGAALRLIASQEAEAQRFRHLLLVNDLGRKVNSILDAELLLQQAALDVHRTFGFHNVMVFMQEHDRGQRLVLKAQAGTHGVGAHANADVDLDQGIVGRAYQRAATVVVNDVEGDPDFVPWFPDTRSEIAVPIPMADTIAGVLNVESDTVGGFGDSERIVLETVANQLATALENARLFAMVKEREDRYRVLVESNPGAVMHLDELGGIVFANPAASELTGLPKATLLSRDATLAQIAAPEDSDTVGEAVVGALGGTPQSDVEFQVQQPDGTIRHALASLQPLEDDDGVVHGVVVLALDRTRERELQERLYQSEKLSAIGGLVSGVAHELNNPLAGILGFAQLLLSRPTEEWARPDVEKIEKNARRCQSIVENLLTFARQARLSRKVANLNEIIESVLRLNEYQFHVDDIEVRRDFDMRLPALQLDVNRWQQVFVNIASNAHQAMVQAGSERRVLTFETRYKTGQVSVRICDTGPGIPEELRSRVFDPFFTTKDSGTGLGLGICYGIVTEHGGTIEVEPGPEEGTCFHITLPVEASHEMAPIASRERHPARSDEGAGRRVLVVDDEEYVRDVVARALQNHGYVVDAVEDGESALEHIEAHLYDAVLCDVSMPGACKGVDLYDLIEERHAKLAERFIFLTGHRHDDALTSQMDARGGRCIEKPFDIHDLARQVGAVATAPHFDGHAPRPEG